MKKAEPQKKETNDDINSVPLTNIINTKAPKKRKIKLICIIIITILALFFGVKIFNNSSEYPPAKVMVCLKNTINLSKQQLNEIFGIIDYYNMFKFQNYSVDLDFYENNLDLDFNLNINSNDKGEKAINVTMFQKQILDIFLDRSNFYISSNILSNNLYKLNYKKLENKFSYLLENKNLTEEEKLYLKILKIYFVNFHTYSKELDNFYKTITNKIVSYLKNIDYVNLPPIKQYINDENVKLEGYRFNIKVDEILELNDLFFTMLEENETLKEYYILTLFLTNYDTLYTSVEQAEEDFNYMMQDAKDEINIYFQQYNPESNYISADFYIYNDFIANSKIYLWDLFDTKESGAEFFIEYKTNGGQVPLNNASYTIFNHNKKILKISTTEDNTDEDLNFSLSIEDKYNYIGVSIYYNKLDKTFTISDIDNMISISGEINEFEPGENLDFYLKLPLFNYLNGNLRIKITDKPNINKPEQAAIDILDLDKNQLKDALEEIENLIFLYFYNN